MSKIKALLVSIEMLRAARKQLNEVGETEAASKVYDAIQKARHRLKELADSAR